MIELPEVFSLIGKVLTADRDELILEINNQKELSYRNVSKLVRTNNYKGRERINNFISKTIFSPLFSGGALTLSFDSDEAKSCQKLLQQHFGIKDETVIKFFELLENASCFDIEKFADCLKIIYRQEINISESPFYNDIKFFLVIGLFDEIVHDEPIEKIFLQKVDQNEVLAPIITHEELSIELYQFSQLLRVKKFMQKSSQIRGY
jgi:hypothetical protein